MARKQTQPTLPPNCALLTVQQAAYLEDCSVPTIIRRCDTGLLDCVCEKKNKNLKRRIVYTAERIQALTLLLKKKKYSV